MEKGLLLFLVLTGTLIACQQRPSGQSESEKLLGEIDQLEKQLLETGDASKEKETAMVFISKCKQYAEGFPADAQSPVLLFKAADVARGAKEYGKAVQLWGKVWRNYSDHPKAPMALFLQGFTFDSELRDTKMAGKYYRNFLNTYPEDSLATQVKQLLEVVEMSPEDLIKQFEKKQ